MAEKFKRIQSLDDTYRGSTYHVPSSDYSLHSRRVINPNYTSEKKYFANYSDYLTGKKTVKTKTTVPIELKENSPFSYTVRLPAPEYSVLERRLDKFIKKTLFLANMYMYTALRIRDAKTEEEQDLTREYAEEWQRRLQDYFDFINRHLLLVFNFKDNYYLTAKEPADIKKAVTALTRLATDVYSITDIKNTLDKFNEESYQKLTEVFNDYSGPRDNPILDIPLEFESMDILRDSLWKNKTQGLKLLDFDDLNPDLETLDFIYENGVKAVAEVLELLEEKDADEVFDPQEKKNLTRKITRLVNNLVRYIDKDIPEIEESIAIKSSKKSFSRTGISSSGKVFVPDVEDIENRVKVISKHARTGQTELKYAEVMHDATVTLSNDTSGSISLFIEDEEFFPVSLSGKSATFSIPNKIFKLIEKDTPEIKIDGNSLKQGDYTLSKSTPYVEVSPATIEVSKSMVKTEMGRMKKEVSAAKNRIRAAVEELSDYYESGEKPYSVPKSLSGLLQKLEFAAKKSLVENTDIGFKKALSDLEREKEKGISYDDESFDHELGTKEELITNIEEELLLLGPLLNTKGELSFDSYLSKKGIKKLNKYEDILLGFNKQLVDAAYKYKERESAVLTLIKTNKGVVKNIRDVEKLTDNPNILEVLSEFEEFALANGEISPEAINAENSPYGRIISSESVYIESDNSIENSFNPFMLFAKQLKLNAQFTLNKALEKYGNFDKKKSPGKSQEKARKLVDAWKKLIPPGLKEDINLDRRIISLKFKEETGKITEEEAQELKLLIDRQNINKKASLVSLNPSVKNALSNKNLVPLLGDLADNISLDSVKSLFNTARAKEQQILLAEYMSNTPTTRRLLSVDLVLVHGGLYELYQELLQDYNRKPTKPPVQLEESKDVDGLEKPVSLYLVVTHSLGEE